MSKRSESAISERTAHVKLTERQWARLDEDEAKERKRRERVGDESSMDGYKVRRIRHLVSLGLLLEKHRRAERRSAMVKRYVIEFRNGSYLGSVDAEEGVSIDAAMKFIRRQDAEVLADKHVWIRANGGMVAELREGVLT